MAVPVTSLYAGLLTFIFLILTIRVVRNRHQKRIGILYGDGQEMAQVVRVHGNFAEYVPIVLILMALSELNGVSAYFLHALGIVLVISRISHAVGLTRTTKGGPFRVYAMYATALLMIVGGGTAILWPYYIG